MVADLAVPLTSIVMENASLKTVTKPLMEFVEYVMKNIDFKMEYVWNLLIKSVKDVAMDS